MLLDCVESCVCVQVTDLCVSSPGLKDYPGCLSTNLKVLGDIVWFLVSGCAFICLRRVSRILFATKTMQTVDITVGRMYLYVVI